MSLLLHVASGAKAFLDTQTVLVLLVSFLGVLWFIRRGRNYPPGHWKWPILGNIPHIYKDPHLVYTRWAREYGPVLHVRLGQRDAVVLNGYDTVHKAFVGKAEDFSGRPTFIYFINKISDGGKGVIFAPYGPFWKEQRKFTLMSLRDFGFGKRSIEGKIIEESQALQSEIAKFDGQPFSTHRLLQNAVANVICNIVFGDRWEYDDPLFQRMMDALDYMVSTNVFAVPQNFIPFTRYIPGWEGRLKPWMKKFLSIMGYLREELDKHKASFDPNDLRDFIDAYLLEIQRQKDVEGTRFQEDQLLQIMRDMFFAGAETTATTIRWTLFYMVVYPDVQRKVYEEIDGVLGKGPPSVSHRSQLPYTDAVLAEVQRIATVVPLGIPRATTNDTTLNGYNIPKDWILFVNLWSVHHDPQRWPEPDKFDPGRFLDDSGKFQKPEGFIPFSTGHRVCLGEQLARVEIFIFVITLLQHFELKLPEGAPVPSRKGRMGVTHAPQPHDIVAIPRD
ncbi:cytochrome P450 2J2-like [Branchiostoma floridae x Branchiostoma belcheri]